MKAKLTFLGAAQNVTGSCYLLEVNGTRVLVDCGMYQERDLKHRNWDEFAISPDSIDAMVMTHAHLDHCGLVPRLVNQGFKGKILCTSATGEIADIVMRDSGKIQEEDMAFKKRRHEKEGRKSPHPYDVLYTREDAEQAAGLLTRAPYHQPVDVADGVQAEFFESGHILGATSIRLRLGGDGGPRILFSGDIGRDGMPLIRDPERIEEADYVVVESTYGNRVHESNEDIPERLADVINHTHKEGGNIVIPSFAVERAQDIVWHLHQLVLEKRIPNTLIFVDSPMAIRVTDVFKRHPELFDEEVQEMREKGIRIADYAGLHLTRSVEESKAINRIRGGAVIIAGSGMCTGGRVKHHLINNIARPESTVLFVGYQAIGTLGRVIVDGAEEVRIHGRAHPVKARVEKLGGFSGHADQRELLAWMSGLKTKPRHVYVTHGEISSAETFAGLLETELEVAATVPAFRDSVALT